MPHRNITGLLLSGGEGTRMGGVDKGLVSWHGRPLVEWVLERLRPQVATVLVSANRHLERYAGYGHPVVTDGTPSRAGPLAGVLAGLRAATTDWVLTVPCDGPHLPLDLADRLMSEVALRGTPLAMAAVQGKYQPMFCLLRTSLAASLASYLAADERKAARWILSQDACVVDFDDPAAFANANTEAELRSLERARDA